MDEQLAAMALLVLAGMFNLWSIATTAQQRRADQTWPKRNDSAKDADSICGCIVYCRNCHQKTNHVAIKTRHKGVFAPYWTVQPGVCKICGPRTVVAAAEHQDITSAVDRYRRSIYATLQRDADRQQQHQQQEKP